MNESIFLTKEMLLNDQDELAIEKVDLKNSKGEIRGHVYVREMTATEKDTWEASLRKEVPLLGNRKGQTQTEFKMDLKSFRAKLAICTICDKDGNRQFDMTPQVVKALGDKLSASNMEAIADVASRLNAITDKDQEELLKNSEAIPENGSNSGSAEN